MDTFREEIYKMVDFLFLCGERLLETESFILELTRRKNTSSGDNWRKQLAAFLDESKIFSCQMDIFDKRTHVTVVLNQLNPLKLRNLYMELAAHLDLEEDYEITQSTDSVFYSISRSNPKLVLGDKIR